MRAENVSEHAQGGPERVIGSQDHACVEAQRRIGKRLDDHTISMKA